MQNDDISYEQAINKNNPAEQMRKYAVALKELRHQPVDLVIERLCSQKGMVSMIILFSDVLRCL